MARRWIGKAFMETAKLRRRMRGPVRDAWSIEMEAWMRLMHHYGKRSTLLPLGLQRRALHALSKPPAANASVTVTAADADGVPCAWFRPRGADPDRVLVYLHGGGYSIGSIATHREYIAKLARRAKVQAFAVDYRLAPEHPFPAQLDDARRVWGYLLDAGVDASRTVIAGESAGGGLTMSTLLALRDAGDPLPAAAAVLSPWVDLTMSSPSIRENERYDYVHARVLEVYAKRFARDVRRDHPLVSPLFADLEGLPPLLVQAGALETLRDDAISLSRRAREAGVDVELSVYDDMVHAFMLFAGVPDAQRATDEIVRFVQRHTSSD
ncbi:MAG: alpha/beta hydrolase [Sandaracinaceae bacterium]